MAYRYFATPKGLYARALAGEIKVFTGISAAYEAPESSELEIVTEHLALNESVARIKALIV